jgi:hypothetical protein
MQWLDAPTVITRVANDGHVGQMLVGQAMAVHVHESMHQNLAVAANVGRDVTSVTLR